MDRVAEPEAIEAASLIAGKAEKYDEWVGWVAPQVKANIESAIDALQARSFRGNASLLFVGGQVLPALAPFAAESGNLQGVNAMFKLRSVVHAVRSLPPKNRLTAVLAFADLLAGTESLTATCEAANKQKGATEQEVAHQIDHVRGGIRKVLRILEGAQPQRR